MNLCFVHTEAPTIEKWVRYFSRWVNLILTGTPMIITCHCLSQTQLCSVNTTYLFSCGMEWSISVNDKDFGKTNVLSRWLTQRQFGSWTFPIETVAKFMTVVMELSKSTVANWNGLTSLLPFGTGKQCGRECLAVNDCFQ